jgi:hypothetical protein
MLNALMVRSLITILLVFTFVAPTLASIGQCEMTSSHCAEEMACCQQAQAVTGSAAARLCCEIFCGEPLDKGAETDANAPRATSLLTPVAGSHPLPLLVFQTAAQVNLVVRVTNSVRSQQRPLPLFLSHSAFLI